MTCIFQHPIRAKPYDLIKFVRQDGNKVALYKVAGCAKPERKAFEALGEAFSLAGGSCFYCGKKFRPQRFDKAIAHRDHVIATSAGGNGHLHNLVIACAHCGSAKKDLDIFDFRPCAAKKFQRAVAEHLARCVGKASAA